MTQFDEPPPATNGSLGPGKLTPEEWLRTVYQGDHARQLSVRSILTGMLLGGLMSISNLYVGIKTGWGLGVTITACVLAYALHKTLESLFPRHFGKDPFTILENYTMSSAASAAGYMSSAGLVSAFPALYLTTGRVLTWWELMVWVACISTLGVFMAIPLKRRLINEEQLPFPSGIATAETLRSLHAEGEVSLAKARSLLWAAGIGLIVKIGHELGPYLHSYKSLARFHLDKYALRPELPLIFWPMGEWTVRAEKWLKDLSIGIGGSTVMLAAAIMGLRVCLTMLFGSVLFFGVIGS
ncbi:MAG: OPT/YSL family transporter [Planctomycetales bacterium]